MKNSDKKVTKCYVRNLDTFNNILRERGLLELNRDFLVYKLRIFLYSDTKE